MQQPAQLLFLSGAPAVGKLTISREISELTGLPLFHNHLVVDAASSVFPFGSAPFIRLREMMWLEVFREAAAEKRSLIFTVAIERKQRGRPRYRAAHFACNNKDSRGIPPRRYRQLPGAE